MGKRRHRKDMVAFAAAGSLVGGMLAMLGAGPAGATLITAPTTVRVSAIAATGAGELSALNADGRFDVFVGRGTTAGVWLVDRLTNTAKHLTAGKDMNPAISPTGRFVAYATYGSKRGVSLLDTQTGKTTVESVTSTGAVPSGGSGLSDYPSVSAGGRYVAFQSTAQLAGPTTTGGSHNKVYVHDNVTGTTTMASVTSSGGGIGGGALYPDITPDGHYVAFTSTGKNLLPSGVTSTTTQVYVHDMTTGTTTIASVSSTGAVATGGSSGGTEATTPTATPVITPTTPVTETAALTSYGPSISDNGQYVAFESNATNLVTGDTNGVIDAFVHDMTTGATTRVSVTATGGQAVPSPLPTGVTPATPLVGGAAPQVSGDGSTVAFESEAPLTSTDHNGVMDVYAYAMAGGAVERISVPAAGGSTATGTRTEGKTGKTVSQVNGADPSVDIDGRYVSFTSNGNLSDDRPLTTEGTNPTAVSTEAAIYVRTRNVPTVTGVSPSSVGLARSGQTLTLTGTNFTPPSVPGDLAVSVGTGVTVTSVTWVSSTQLKVTVDVAWNAALGARVVGVTNPGTDVGSLATGLTLTARGTGYRMAASDGGIFAFGDAGFYGSMGGKPLNQPVVGLADTGSGDGYWLVASDGGIFAFGDAGFYGSMGGKPLNQPIVGIAADHTSHGYWEVARDGGIFAFGDAGFYGSMGGKPLNEPIVGMAATPDGAGYWLVATDGGIFAFGDAGFYGSMGGKPLNQPIVGMAQTPTGDGYWLVARDGGIFAFGDAGFYGSMGGKKLNQPIVGMAAMPTGGGYWLVARDGGVFAYGSSDFWGSMGGQPLNEPVVAMTAD